MAFHLKMEKTTSTPYVLLDEEKKYMKLEGRSFHDGVMEFFEPINNWLESYLCTDFGTFVFDCGMDYFNSSTIKALFVIITKMDRASVGDNKVIVNWITTSDNEIIIECGEDFSEDVCNLEFNLVISE
ncbi:MAG: DUF1987 domain-containing protein [Lachnospiraceae bacterium]|nr:DUF1987 domain-containing protein [Lachnospiraceae bacterium]